MRVMRCVLPLIAGIVICSGCGNSGPAGRLVICDDSGRILGDVSFSVRGRPPSAGEIQRKLNALAPTLPKDGRAVRVAAAIMYDPSDEFRRSKTLSAFEKSLIGSQTSTEKFPCFDAVNEEQGIVVWQHDPGKWMDKTDDWQMKDPGRSDYWRCKVAGEFAYILQNSPSYCFEHHPRASKTTRAR